MTIDDKREQVVDKIKEAKALLKEFARMGNDGDGAFDELQGAYDSLNEAHNEVSWSTVK